MKEAVIVDGLRTPMGKYGGILREIRPDDLAALVISELLKRNHVPADQVDDVYFGCGNQAGEDNRNVARMAALLAGLPVTVPGVTVNRLCASGLEAVVSAARAVMVGDGEVYVAGGVESMTRAPFVMPKASKPFQRGNVPIYDTTIGWRFVNPRMAKAYPPLAMGETAENVAEKYRISRGRQDEFALRSHVKALDANETGIFKDEIIPVETSNGNVTKDEGPRRDASLEKLSALKPVFRDGGTVTAGNSSPISDGAAAVLVMERDAADQMGLKPSVRLMASAVVGVDPSYMGIGPVPASRSALQKAGIALNDIDLIELNEAFAAQVLACVEQLEIDPNRLNPHGGAIALGHPIGCSGARLVTTLIHEMKRENHRYGLVTLCVGVGQGMAAVFERI